MAFALLFLAIDRGSGPPVSNDDRVSVKLKSPARITHLVLRVFNTALSPLMVAFVPSRELGK
jgi:hypothetical protein